VAYNCVVLAKQVPDTKRITGQVMNDDGTVNRSALPAVFNPEDLNALELALQIKDKFGGSVTVISMGPPAAAAILRDSLFRGADDVVLITDPGCAASDTLATSYILSCAVKKIDYDIVLCGRQAIDGDTAQVGPQLAEKLGITQITYVEELTELNGKNITVRRNIGNGWQQVRTSLPVLLTVTGDANEPRVAAAKKMMKYKSARTPIELKREIKSLPRAQSRGQKSKDAVFSPHPHGGGQKSEKGGQKTQYLAPTLPQGILRTAVGGRRFLAPTPAVGVRNQKAEDRKQKSEINEEEIKKLVEQQCDKLQQKGLLIKQWDLNFIGADLNRCGLSGSPTKVHRIQSVILAAKESKEIQPTDEGIADMIHELIEDKVIA
jgi:electron transfer flavoprotein beta subunit